MIPMMSLVRQLLFWRFLPKYLAGATVQTQQCKLVDLGWSLAAHSAPATRSATSWSAAWSAALAPAAGLTAGRRGWGRRGCGRRGFRHCS